MKYNSTIFVSQFPIVKNFVYHLSYYRCLHKTYSKADFLSEFWAYTNDAHLLQATISWCKVFGSDGCNETHWKNLNSGDMEKLKLSFTEGLKSSCGMAADEWKKYWQEITNFRNKYVAHREVRFNAPVPSFDRALDIAFFYDRWVRIIIKPDHLAEGSLKLFSESLLKKIETPLNSIVQNSKSILNGI